MITIRHRRRLVPAVIASALAAGVPAVASAAQSTADNDDIEVTVVDEGDPNHRVLLIPAASTGTMIDATTTFDIDMSMVGSGYPIDLDLVTAGSITRTSEVLDVAGDGAFTARETITAFELTNTTPDGEPLDPEELGLERGSTT